MISSTGYYIDGVCILQLMDVSRYQLPSSSLSWTRKPTSRLTGSVENQSFITLRIIRIKRKHWKDFQCISVIWSCFKTHNSLILPIFREFSGRGNFGSDNPESNLYEYYGSPSASSRNTESKLYYGPPSASSRCSFYSNNHTSTGRSLPPTHSSESNFCGKLDRESR